MRAEFPNGAGVFKAWGDCNEGELLAAFTYFEHAAAFAEKIIEQEPNNVTLYAVCSYSGKFQCFRRPTPDKEPEA